MVCDTRRLGDLPVQSGSDTSPFNIIVVFVVVIVVVVVVIVIIAIIIMITTLPPLPISL